MKWGMFCKKSGKWGVFFVKKWKMWGVFCKKKWKTGCVFFFKKWTFHQRRVHCVQYKYFFILRFTYLGGGVRTHPVYGPEASLNIDRTEGAYFSTNSSTKSSSRCDVRPYTDSSRNMQL